MLTRVRSAALISYFATNICRENCYENNEENDPLLLKDLSYRLAGNIKCLPQFGK